MGETEGSMMDSLPLFQVEFIFGVDYDLVKTDYVYGLQYRRWGGQNVYGIKLGVNLNTLFKRIKNGP